MQIPPLSQTHRVAVGENLINRDKNQGGQQQQRLYIKRQADQRPDMLKCGKATAVLLTMTLVANVVACQSAIAAKPRQNSDSCRAKSGTSLACTASVKSVTPAKTPICNRSDIFFRLTPVAPQPSPIKQSGPPNLTGLKPTHAEMLADSKTWEGLTAVTAGVPVTHSAKSAMKSIKLFPGHVDGKEHGFIFDLHTGYFYQPATIDSLQKNPWAMQAPGSSTMIPVTGETSLPLTHPQQRKILEAAGLGHVPLLLSDLNLSGEALPLPPIMNQFWVGPRRIPASHLNALKHNHAMLKEGKSGVKQHIYLSNRDPVVYQINAEAVRKAAPSASIICLETSDFMKSFAQWNGGRYMALYNRMTELSKSGGNSWAFVKDILLFGSLAGHQNSEWQGGGMGMDLDEKFIKPPQGADFFTPLNVPLLGQIGSHPMFDVGDVFLNNAAGVHRGDPLPQAVLDVSLKNLHLYNGLLDPQHSGDAAFRQQYYSTLSAVSCGISALDEALKQTGQSPALALEAMKLPWNEGFMVPDSVRNMVFEIRQFPKLTQENTQSWLKKS